MKRSLRFEGSGLKLLKYWLYSFLLTAAIIPAVWGVLPIYRWATEGLTTSRGERGKFTGSVKTGFVPFYCECELRRFP